MEPRKATDNEVAQHTAYRGLEDAYDTNSLSIPELAERMTFKAVSAIPNGVSLEEYVSKLTPEPTPKAAPSALDVQVSGTHYKNLKIQPVEYIHANNIPFAEGSVIKYVSRWRNKNGIKDLEKAKHFLELLIELERQNGTE
ncbi:DUF3310 domain-containing protein [Methylovorus sp. MM2]|uniref:DUF3310 domain-containing protein n=1 Tax=Methylovorus sp. MM2 TaxID=1848038 RepID=UPI001C2773AD|nr:DUF3310 domain-containing protein [Methylovorus sp. MM2]